MVKAVLLETKMAFLYLQGENNREKRKCRQKSFLIRPCNQSHAPLPPSHTCSVVRSFSQYFILR